MHLVEVTIPNWEKYNPRADRANYSWFRFQNNFFEDPVIGALNITQKVLYIMCLCEASKLNRSGLAIINTAMAGAYLNCKADEIYKSLDTLAKYGCIKAADYRLKAGVKPAQLPATRRTYETERNETKGEGEIGASASLPSLVAIWNSNCGELPKVKKSNASRNKVCSSRMKDFSETEWVEIVKRIASSSFCCGKNDRGWRATFDWLLKPDTPLKVLEGKYDGGDRNKKSLVEILKEAGHVDE